MSIYLIDTETTGLVKPQVIELAWTLYDRNKPSDSEQIYCQRFLPTKAIELGAMATHHIQLSDLSDCPPSSTATLPLDTEYIIGHNVDYDWKALGSPPVKRICTQALARSLLPTLDSHRLGALIYHFCPKMARSWLKKAHEASADVELCKYILFELLRMRDNAGHARIDTAEELWQVSEAARIPKIMSFGKHKGEPIESVPAGYVSWYLKQVDPDPYLVKAFQLVKAARR